MNFVHLVGVGSARWSLVLLGAWWLVGGGWHCLGDGLCSLTSISLWLRRKINLKNICGMCKINFFLFARSRSGRQLTNDCASKVYGFWLPFLINGTAETGILLKINKNDCDCTNTQKDISGGCCCSCCFKPLVNLNKF